MFAVWVPSALAWTGGFQCQWAIWEVSGDVSRAVGKRGKEGKGRRPPKGVLASKVLLWAVGA